MTFAEKLVQLRKAKGLSQEALALQLHVSRQAISRWELGSAMPDSPNLLQISRLFEVSADYLLNDDYEEPTPQPAPQPLPEEAKGKPLLIAGICTTILSLLGVFALWLWSCLSPAVNTIAPEGADSGIKVTVRYGLPEFLQMRDQMWLLWLCIAGLAAGIALMVVHRVRSNQHG